MFADSSGASLHGLDTDYIRKSNVAEHTTIKGLQLSGLHSKLKVTFANWNIFSCIFVFKHLQWWASVQLSFDASRHLGPWSCFWQQSFWFSLWKPTASGTGSLGRLLEVSRWSFNVDCCQLNWDLPFLLLTACDCVQELLLWGALTGTGRQASWGQERTRGQMGCKGDQVSVRIVTPSQIDMTCRALALCVCFRSSDAREWVQTKSGGEPLRSQCWQTKGSSEKILVHLQMAKKSSCGKAVWFQENPKFTFFICYHYAFASVSSSHHSQCHSFCIVGSYNFSSQSDCMLIFFFFTCNKHRLKDWLGVLYLYFS